MALLSASHLTKCYDQKAVVDNISFQFQSGNCIALIGPNGAGKTTTLRMLAGLVKPSAGTIKFSEAKAREDRRQFIGYLPQYPTFFKWMSGKEFLVYVGRLAYLTKKDAIIRAERLLKRVGLEKEQNKRIGSYSGGMKQRLGIAQAIIHDPKLLILDEPVSSLDPIGRREVLALMNELKAEMTVLFSTHILGDADIISDDVLLLHQGKVVESGTIAGLRNKYQTTEISLTFQRDAQTYQKQVDALPSIVKSYIENDTIYATATDIEAARMDILRLAAEENWPLTSFSLNRASLEDMFMKVVSD